MEQQNNINNQDEDIKKDNDKELHKKRLKRKRLKKILKRRRKRKRIAYINNLPLIKLLSKIDDKLFLKKFYEVYEQAWRWLCVGRYLSYILYV